jgi:hypothetical protein
MRKFGVFLMMTFLVLATGCDKKEEEGAKGVASATAATAAAATASGAPAAKAAATGAAANDPVVCCKFGGVKGSSTKKLCEDGKGTVVPDGECPTLKK